MEQIRVLLYKGDYVSYSYMVTTEYIITSLSYPATPASLPVTKLCHKAHSQACFHYSSAMANNAQWATLTCPAHRENYDYKKPYSKGKNGS
ncbi:hypothetical protein G6O67_006362 [Ophiocordyceps sinensis]|uniref:Uncharacterized protein n=1 Tax=Ophiocordyceps sinensis TaxID=72228 RepID=A0A8H4PMX6_9HYPO|nr:hypothetical protein G6O67_006362 [Ophiocordyceps sinensis]